METAPQTESPTPDPMLTQVAAHIAHLDTLPTAVQSLLAEQIRINAHLVTLIAQGRQGQQPGREA